ncbi:hypothetical protein [Aestuariivirga sp.]|uniref:hypothetical protein n=1 Tax=Aestuariivirga sp. TaxID=2650926 RepID=UPI00391AE075
MITRRSLLAMLASGTAALALAGCQIDTRTPIRVSEILSVAQSGTPVPVSSAITAQFVTPEWCKVEGTLAIETISSPELPLQLDSCAKGGPGAIGQFQLGTSLVRTDGGPDDATILTNVLGTDRARFAVFPHGKHKHLLSVGLFINVPQLAADKAKLVAMPVYKRGLYKKGEVNYSFTLEIINDTDKPARFYLSDVSAGGDLPADEAILTIPPAGSDTVTLDAATQARLAADGWVNFMSMITK